MGEAAGVDNASVVAGEVARPRFRKGAPPLDVASWAGQNLTHIALSATRSRPTSS